MVTPLALRAGIARERHQIIVLGVTGLAPGGEDVDQRHMALAQVGVGEARAAVEPGQVEAGAFWPISAEGMREASPA